MNIVIATIKSWNINNTYLLSEQLGKEVKITLISNPDELNFQSMETINPDYIFFPHWSWRIPSEIYNKWECIVFHMTDLPFGRGGNPLQNLIMRGMTETKISAIRVEEGMDAGDIYLKKALHLLGTADEIFMRASKIIFLEMIPEIIKGIIEPQKQSGEVVVFGRRTSAESEIEDTNLNLEQIFDKIRMLDGEGYPKAFIKIGKYRVEFSRASLKNGYILADAVIMENKNE